MNYIDFEDVTKIYGITRKNTALSDFNLEVEKGEFAGIVGPNGSGKTTALKLLTNSLYPTSGTVSIEGTVVRSNPEKTLCDIGSQIGIPGFSDFDTPRTAYRYYGLMKGMTSESISANTDKILNEVEMGEWEDVHINKFSRGMKQRIAIGLALLNEPEILVFDEPTSGLDPDSHRSVLKMLGNIHREFSSTVVMATHNLHDVDDLCDTVVAIRNGRVISKRNVRDLQRLTGAVNMRALLTKEPEERAIEKMLEDSLIENIEVQDREIIITVLNGEDGMCRLSELLGSMDMGAYELNRADGLKDTSLDFMRGDGE